MSPQLINESGVIGVGLSHYLTLAAILFTIGIFGIFLNRKNLIVIMMSIELMLLAVNINMVAFSSFLNDLVGQVFTMLVLTVAAAEAAIGLAIVVVFYRNRRSIEVEDINTMKG
jgi:NADH-quinone oxidoreductase subunit K